MAASGAAPQARLGERKYEQIEPYVYASQSGRRFDED